MKQWIPVLLTAMLVLAGCRGNVEVEPANALGIDMSVSVAPTPPQTGDATLVVTLREEDGTPIDGASLEIRGDMNHAGMQPVLREVSTSQDGDYRIPFEWTMGGDWFIVVTATLPDGRVVEQQFDYTVEAGEGEMDMDMMGTEEMEAMEMSGTEEMDDMPMDMVTEEAAN